MKKRSSIIISFGLVFLLMGILLTACGSTNTPATNSSVSTPGAPLDGQALMQQRCSVCHTTNRIVEKSATADQWGTTVERMIGKGAQLNDTERQTLIDYLAQTYP
jgi:mono/diheme cytochrome c family protein